MVSTPTIPREFRPISKLYLFFVISFTAIGLAWLVNEILITDDLYFEYFGEQLTYERIVNQIEISKEWSWVGYAILPFIYLIKFFLVAACLSIGILLTGHSVPFKNLFQVAIYGELVFFITPVIKIFWFGVFFTDYTLQDLQYFSPVSLLSLVDRDSIEPWLVYPLQLVNVFEIVYWLILAFGLYSLTNERYSKMLGLVASSYGVGLLLWTVFIVFLSVSIAP